MSLDLSFATRYLQEEGALMATLANFSKGCRCSSHGFLGSSSRRVCCLFDAGFPAW